MGLESVETLSVNTGAGTLRYKGVGVYLVDEVENEVALRLLCDAKHHLQLLIGIESVAVERGAASLGNMVDGLAYLVPFGADDEKLYAHAHAVDDIIDKEGKDEQQHVAIEHFLPIVEHQLGGGDDRKVADEDHVSQRDVAVVVYDGRDDI